MHSVRRRNNNRCSVANPPAGHTKGITKGITVGKKRHKG